MTALGERESDGGVLQLVCASLSRGWMSSSCRQNALRLSTIRLDRCWSTRRKIRFHKRIESHCSSVGQPWLCLPASRRRAHFWGRLASTCRWPSCSTKTWCRWTSSHSTRRQSCIWRKCCLIAQWRSFDYQERSKHCAKCCSCCHSRRDASCISAYSRHSRHTSGLRDLWWQLRIFWTFETKRG